MDSALVAKQALPAPEVGVESVLENPSEKRYTQLIEQEWLPPTRVTPSGGMLGDQLGDQLGPQLPYASRQYGSNVKELTHPGALEQTAAQARLNELLALSIPVSARVLANKSVLSRPDLFALRTGRAPDVATLSARACAQLQAPRQCVLPIPQQSTGIPNRQGAGQQSTMSNGAQFTAREIVPGEMAIVHPLAEYWEPPRLLLVSSKVPAFEVFLRPTYLCYPPTLNSFKFQVGVVICFGTAKANCM